MFDREARSPGRLLFLTLAASVLLAGLIPAAATAAPTTMVNLGQASTYGVLSGASVDNTVSAVGAPHTVVRGDLGVKANAEPTGFPPGVVTGAPNVGNPAAGQAHTDAVAAYNEIAARAGGELVAADLIGETLLPGLYKTTGAVANTGTLTLDGGGDPNAVFVIQVNGALAFAAASKVVLTNGAQASRVFWQVNGAGALGANAEFVGTLIAMDAVGIGNGTLVNGRAFARNGALTLDNNQIYSNPPSMTIAGGTSASTTDSSPIISGTTDVESPATVTVTVDGQTLTATPTAGAWSVTSGLLANGTYTVAASTTDGAGNESSATQELTVDTEPPVVSLDGGASVTTSNSTPTFSGTSDVAEGTAVRVTVGSQTLNALVNSSGTWNVRSAALSDGTYTVTASVTDPAGNESTDSQSLTVDTVGPTVRINGGKTKLTNDPTPRISGSSDVAEGTAVTVTLANETLTGLVKSDGSWSVTAAALSDGSHRVVASVSDATGNQSSFTQTLTVDTVAPRVSINGGASATTQDTTPTLRGTSTAAPGTTVTVTINGQTMTTLLQADGSWNTTAASVGAGTWQVVASAPDPAGNVGRDTQDLTVQTTTPDTTAPETTIDSGPSGSISSDSATFAFGSSEQGLTFHCELDGGGFAACTSPQSYSGLSEGERTFSVRATDAAGNTAASPATRTFTVDTAEPELVLGGKRKQTLRRAVTVFASCDEACLTAVRGKLVIKPDGQSAKRFKLKPKRAELAADAKTKLRPKLTRRAHRVAKRTLKQDGKVMARLQVRSVDAAGNVTVQRRNVRLRL